MTKADEPAFPNIGDRVEDTKDGFVFTPVHKGGLTKREYFAAMAMQGLCSTYTIGRDQSELQVGTAESAVKYADCLIKELEKK